MIKRLLFSVLSLVLFQAVVAQNQSAPPIHPNQPIPPPPTKPCGVIVGYPGKPDIKECTSVVQPDSSITCLRALGGAKQCHLHFLPSGFELDIPVNQSAGNDRKDDTVTLTCPGTPQGPYGLQCGIGIRPNPDYPHR
jgi:hypothetical protein